ncbi:ankyrin-1-like isoform X4 [Penaeus japonicus]|uniref:ankyrin-1-like isoform X4 n=1 Tax=Penaeus japonicus TaxID=27405 RepID=UPI001C70E1E6|nr:ankyrin-1-like isoform X4 [Penaeus japonicus]
MSILSLIPFSPFPTPPRVVCVKVLIEHRVNMTILVQLLVTVCVALCMGTTPVLSTGTPRQPGSTLMGAIRKGETETVLALLEAGASPATLDQAGQSALQVAARYGAGNVVQALLSRRAEIDTSDNWGKTPLHEAAWYGQDDVVKILLENNASLAVHDKSGKVPLHEAVWFGRIGVVRTLLEHGADVNTVDDNGLTPLHYAAELESVTILGALLARGGDSNARDKEGMTPLHYAAWFGHEEVVTTLLSHEADMTLQDLQGHTALHYAVEHGELGAVAVLLEAGADVDVQDNSGNTVVHLACRSPEPWLMVALLLLRCPRLTVRNVIYKTAADVAMESGLDDLATLINAQSRTPCGVEGTACEREGELAVTPLRPLTCNSTWTLAASSPSHEDCWHKGQLYRHWSSWYDGCRENRCVQGHVLRDPYTGTSCCQVGEDVYPENATWSQGCYHYRCSSGNATIIAVLTVALEEKMFTPTARLGQKDATASSAALARS